MYKIEYVLNTLNMIIITIQFYYNYTIYNMIYKYIICDIIIYSCRQLYIIDLLYIIIDVYYYI